LANFALTPSVVKSNDAILFGFLLALFYNWADKPGGLETSGCPFNLKESHIEAMSFGR
jgi:hypothetical protein